ncbi:MAG: ferrochelatase [Gammaproteobacteria bacterium]|jgi:ferrochelatase|nr:ferrochelatase [Gammaproteobacteria bacterium]
MTKSHKIGVLLANLGTPEAPTPAAVKKYLAEFLSDTRVIDKPKWLWWPILHGIILRVRPKRSAHAYQKIWLPKGSPLLVYSMQQAELLQAALGGQYQVELGMRYGKPGLVEALEKLKSAELNQLIILPLYPQYSRTTTASTFDVIKDYLKIWINSPKVSWIESYYNNAGYLQAVAGSISQYWSRHGRPEKLLMSFHGLPQSYVDKGDPYYDQCLETANGIAAILGLTSNQWQLSFQSRVGYEPWLQPYTDKTIAALPEQGIKKLHVVCPGFSADCLETLEEIAMQNRDIFMENGGEDYQYIPALNASTEHIPVLKSLIEQLAGK